jgi:hypothetical protein
MMVTPVSAPNSGAYIFNAPETLPAGDYVVSAWVYGEVGEELNIRLGEKGETTSATAFEAWPETGWRRIEITHPFLGNDVYQITFAAKDTTTPFYVDGVLLEEGLVAKDYFDGDGYIDSFGEYIENTVRTNWTGTIHASTSTFEVTEFPGDINDPKEWPILFRSDDPSGINDPTPVDAKLLVPFNTGQILQDNRISIYLREKALDTVTQLDLNGDLQDAIDALESQPNFGDAESRARVQYDIDRIEDTISGGASEGLVNQASMTQSELSGTLQYDLERIQDTLAAAWIEVRLEWGPSGAVVKLYNAETPGAYHVFNLPFGPAVGEIRPETEFVLRADVEDNGIRIRVNELDVDHMVEEVFDSTVIEDSSLVTRRKGRIGWYAQLMDGDAYVRSVKHSYLNFAEYRSQRFWTDSPVAGSQLFVGATQERELYRGIYTSPWGGVFEADSDRGPEAFRIINDAEAPLQGIQTNTMDIDDFANTTVSFDLFVSQETLNRGSVEAFLWNGAQPIPIPLWDVRGDTWSPVKVNLREVAKDWLPGKWALAIVQSVVNYPNAWGIDKISIMSKSISWSLFRCEPRLFDKARLSARIVPFQNMHPWDASLGAMKNFHPLNYTSLMSSSQP